jgi:hypothetical protein
MATQQNPLAALAAKGNPAPQAPAQDAPSPAAQPDAGSQDNNAPDNDSSMPDDDAGNTVKGSTNLARAFSKLNAALVKLLDEAGVKRSATIPHVESEGPGEHFQNIGQILAQIGGLTANLLVASHSKHSADGGSTVAYPAQKLRETIIPTGDENAKAAIQSCKTLISKIASLIPDAPEIKKAQSQLALVSKNSGSGMTLENFTVALLQIAAGPIKAVARAHSGTKPGGHSPQLRAAAHDPQVQR